MSNGKLINELRELAKKEGEISFKAAIQLILTAMSETTENLQNVANEFKELDIRVRDSIENLAECTEDNSRCTNELKGQMRTLEDQIRELNTRREVTVSEVRAVQANVISISAQLDSIAKVINDKIMKNPIVKAGMMYMEYPLAVKIMVTITILLLNVWMVNGVPGLAMYILDILGHFMVIYIPMPPTPGAP